MFCCDRSVCKPSVDNKLNKPNLTNPPTCTTTKCIDPAKVSKKLTNVKKVTNAEKVTNAIMDNNITEAVYICFPTIIANTSHRDGAIYKNEVFKENWFDIDINDRNESMYPNDHFCCRIFHILEMSIFAQSILVNLWTA